MLHNPAFWYGLATGVLLETIGLAVLILLASLKTASDTDDRELLP